MGDGFFTGEEKGEIFDGAGGLALDALVCARADVRSDDDIGQAEERVVGGRRLLVKHVGGVGEEVLRLEGGDERGEIDEFASAGVDDDGTFFNKGKISGVDEALGGGRELRVQGDDVGLAEDVLEVFDARDVVPTGKVLVPVVAVADDFQAECFGADSDLFADAAEADNSEGLAADLVPGDARPTAGGGVIGLDDEVAHGGEHEAECVFGDRGVIDAGREEHGHLEIGGGFDIDLVEADSVFGNDLEARERFLNDGAGEGVIAAEVGVELSGEFQHARFGERAAFANDLEVGGGQHLVMDAGRVLERSGREEDASHGMRG